MLRELYIENGFKHHKARFEFKPGLTAIVGPNGRGKSLIMEFIRFALFGSRALRGSSDDYKKLKVELTFDIREETYKVTRAGSRTALHKGDQQLAAGTRPVDEKIRELLGYDLLVFDVANACNQGAVEALSNMKPAERKKMVDETIGLNVIDHLIAVENAEALTFQRMAEMLERNLVEPLEPEEIETPWTISSLESEIARLEKIQSRRNYLQGQLASPPVEPTAVMETGEYLDLSALMEHEAQRKDLEERRLKLKYQVAAIPPATHSLEYYTQQRRLIKEWEAFKEAPPFDPPTLTETEIAHQKRLHEEVEHYRSLKARFDRHGLECPECSHVFVPGMTSDEQALLATPPTTPLVTMAEILDQERRHQAWRKYGKPAPKRPSEEAELGMVAINQGEALLARQGEREALLNALEALPVLEDKSESLMKAVAREARHKAYLTALKKYDVEKEVYDKAKAELEMLPEADKDLSKLRQELADLRTYERDLLNYNTALEDYNKRYAEVDSHRLNAEDHSKASSALKELKTKVKSYLLPSLARVASVLVSQMTGGQHKVVVIDDDFNITVDGQSIQTMSGSGKAVTNLALRIGLGQVLTNQVFSLFMADEFDASMDAERAKNTMNSLKSLLKTISQVIVVSHKSHDADHFIDLGGMTSD